MIVLDEQMHQKCLTRMWCNPDLFVESGVGCSFLMSDAAVFKDLVLGVTYILSTGFDETFWLRGLMVKVCENF